MINQFHACTYCLLICRKIVSVTQLRSPRSVWMHLLHAILSTDQLKASLYGCPRLKEPLDSVNSVFLDLYPCSQGCCLGPGFPILIPRSLAGLPHCHLRAVQILVCMFLSPQAFCPRCGDPSYLQTVRRKVSFHILHSPTLFS